MQQVRLILLAALTGLLLLLWDAWQRDYGEAPTPTASEQSAEQPESAEPDPAPAAGGSGEPEAAGPGSPSGSPAGDAATADAKRISVTTDLLELQLSAQGGGIVNAKLREHTLSADDDTPFTLMSEASPLFVAQLGLVGDDAEAPDHQASWSVERDSYRMKSGDDRLVVPLTWTGPDGTQIQRRYVFRRDSYVVDVEHEITNATGSDRRYYQYTQLRREPKGSDQAFLGARSFVGGVVSTPQERYTKYDFGDLASANLNKNVTDGWIAMIQHYFLAAVVPPQGVEHRFYTRSVDNDRILGVSSPWERIAAGEGGSLESRLFIGPKEQDRLAAVGDNLRLDLTVDYGWFHVLSKPLFVVLDTIHDYVGNWGWSIMILVLLIKLVFYKLSEKSYRSMARMRKLQPKMQELRERYSDDKQRMNQEIMELYKREKVNPLGGCLPILIQIPVFIALYWVLLESVELRQAPWILWINDLARPDRYYVLPLLMGASMFLQQKLNPAPMDPIQQKVMMALPVVFTVFFAFFPAGLVLYWVTNNTLSIAQQWIITRRVEAGNDDDGGSGGGGLAAIGQKIRDKAEAQQR
jgi:YidC/Oxa1 family membrane protein insertase